MASKTCFTSPIILAKTCLCTSGLNEVMLTRESDWECRKACLKCSGLVTHAGGLNWHFHSTFFKIKTFCLILSFFYDYRYQQSTPYLILRDLLMYTWIPSKSQFNIVCWSHSEKHLRVDSLKIYPPVGIS